MLNNTTQFVNIDNYQNIRISARSIITFYSQIKRIMKIKITITLSLNIIINISINYHNILFDNQDFLFKLELLIDLNYEKKIFVYIIDISIIFM